VLMPKIHFNGKQESVPIQPCRASWAAKTSISPTGC
jgi:hypothetical protein